MKKQEDIRTKFISGILLGINPDVLEIPDEFREFLKKDDQGMEGFEFMLKDYKLSKRIPTEVRIQYEAIRASVLECIEEAIDEMYKSLDEIKENPDTVINDFIKKAIDQD